MEGPGELDIHADRHVPCFRRLAFVGYDFTDAAFAMQARKQREASGSPVIDLITTTGPLSEGVRLEYAGQDTVQNHILAGRLSSVPTGLDLTTTLWLSIVAIQITETTLESAAVGYASTRANDLVLFYDLQVTPTASGLKDVYVRGQLIIRAGVTQ